MECFVIIHKGEKKRLQASTFIKMIIHSLEMELLKIYLSTITIQRPTNKLILIYRFLELSMPSLAVTLVLVFGGSFDCASVL